MGISLALAITGGIAAAGDQAPPDLQMLLHLDLFERQPSPPTASGEPAASSSMLDQIQALDAMGYLNADGAENDLPMRDGAPNQPDLPPEGPNPAPEGQ